MCYRQTPYSGAALAAEAAYTALTWKIPCQALEFVSVDGVHNDQGDAAVIKEPAQGRPAGECIADRLGEAAACGEPWQLGFQPAAQCIDEGPGT